MTLNLVCLYKSLQNWIVYSVKANSFHFSFLTIAVNNANEAHWENVTAATFLRNNTLLFAPIVALSKCPVGGAKKKNCFIQNGLTCVATFYCVGCM